jgi:hypothetical protein
MAKLFRVNVFFESEEFPAPSHQSHLAALIPNIERFEPIRSNFIEHFIKATQLPSPFSPFSLPLSVCVSVGERD